MCVDVCDWDGANRNVKDTMNVERDTFDHVAVTRGQINQFQLINVNYMFA